MAHASWKSAYGEPSENCEIIPDMDQWKLQRGHWSRMRWLWLAFSLLGLISTPGAVFDALNTYKADHRLGWIIPVAFAMRFGHLSAPTVEALPEMRCTKVLGETGLWEPWHPGVFTHDNSGCRG